MRIVVSFLGLAKGIEESQLQDAKSRYLAFRAQLQPGLLKATRARGVVVVGGRSRSLRSLHGRAGPFYTLDALLAIASLRRAGCRLPVELWHDHDPELTGDKGAMAMSSFSVVGSEVVLRDVWSLPGGQQVTGYGLITTALLNSEFKEVLYLDADVTAVTDPTPLFAKSEYTMNGALFWPDYEYIKLEEDNPIWRIIEHEPEPALDTDSGQIIINRIQYGEQLALMDFFNNQESAFYHQFSFGDIALWHFAWLAFGNPLPQLRDRFMIVGYKAEKHERIFCGHSSMTDKPDGIVFLHRSTYKFSVTYGDDRPRWHAIKHVRKEHPVAPVRLTSKECQCHWRFGFWPCRDSGLGTDESAKSRTTLANIAAIEGDMLVLRSKCLHNRTALRPQWWLVWAQHVSEWESVAANITLENCSMTASSQSKDPQVFVREASCRADRLRDCLTAFDTGGFATASGMPAHDDEVHACRRQGGSHHVFKSGLRQRLNVSEWPNHAHEVRLLYAGLRQKPHVLSAFWRLAESMSICLPSACTEQHGVEVGWHFILRHALNVPDMIATLPVPPGAELII